MSTEDVLERADKWMDRREWPSDDPRVVVQDQADLIIGMSLALRSARERIAELERILRREDDAVEIRISFRNHHIARTVPAREIACAKELPLLAQYVARDMLTKLGESLDAAMAAERGGE